MKEITGVSERIDPHTQKKFTLPIFFPRSASNDNIWDRNVLLQPLIF